jgi:outer membrane protein OmpA-like peptidoglycan-associated protein
MHPTEIVFALTLALALLPASAGAGNVLKGKEITESALIDALTPAENIRTRNITVMRDDQPGDAGGASKPAKPVKPASASLLITFKTNSAELTAGTRQSLAVVALALGSAKLASARFAIEGHADPRGSAAANLRLSQARAESVRQYLIQHHHVDPVRLDAIGKGDTELINQSNPIAPENRRVTIVNLSQ